VRAFERAILRRSDGRIKPGSGQVRAVLRPASVSVYDFHLHRSVTVSAGHSYFAALGNLRACR
jgi:hypothetical protein